MFKTKVFTRIVSAISIGALAFLQVSCDEKEPAKEDTPELITQVTLTFTPTGGGEGIVVKAIDPDGVGVQDMDPEAIALKLNTTYTLSITLINGLADPVDPEYDITDEVNEESDEHIFFFSWDGGFTNPAGNGNIDNRADAVNYNDSDVNTLPLGLSTSWTTSGVAAAGKKFRILLKHQPGVKTATSDSTDGETDLDVEFDLSIAN